MAFGTRVLKYWALGPSGLGFAKATGLEGLIGSIPKSASRRRRAQGLLLNMIFIYSTGRTSWSNSARIDRSIHDL